MRVKKKEKGRTVGRKGRRKKEAKKGIYISASWAPVKSVACLEMNKNIHKYLDLAQSWTTSLTSMQILWPSLVFFKNFIFIFKLFIIVDFQDCVSFCYTAATHSFSHAIFSHGLSQEIGCSSLYCAVGSHPFQMQ